MTTPFTVPLRRRDITEVKISWCPSGSTRCTKFQLPTHTPTERTEDREPAPRPNSTTTHHGINSCETALPTSPAIPTGTSDKTGNTYRHSAKPKKHNSQQDRHFPPALSETKSRPCLSYTDTHRHKTTASTQGEHRWPDNQIRGHRKLSNSPQITITWISPSQVKRQTTFPSQTKAMLASRAASTQTRSTTSSGTKSAPVSQTA